MKCHPHPDPKHIVCVYRAYILSCKRKFGTARSQVHYRQLIECYLEAKRQGRDHEDKA